jgi:hypothetical protein
LGEVHYFIQEESVGSGIIFILLLSVLNHFLKWQNLVSFYIKFQSRGNKTSPRCLGWTIYSKWYWEYAGKAMFFDKSATKKCCFKLDLQWNPNDFDRDFGVLVCCILMPNSI